jgi:cell fate (sporulation/competence/biofilm development) regulator YlbF (YheA/YmcA/DUF963 family)
MPFSIYLYCGDIMETRVLDKTYDLVEEIKQTKDYNRLLELDKILKTDPTLIVLIESFNRIKEKYDDVSKYGKYHPDLKSVQLELAKQKEEVYTNPIIKEYKQLEKDLQNRLDQISKEIANCVSSKIKHPNEIGLINKH